jgi:hypothetical protein
LLHQFSIQIKSTYEISQRTMVIVKNQFEFATFFDLSMQVKIIRKKKRAKKLFLKIQNDDSR